METVRNTFHAQLATVMDSLLAAAVCEIAKIFESSLCEQQAELTQRGEEISALRGRLERAERKLRKGGDGGDVGTGPGPGRREGGGDNSPRHRADPGAGSSGKDAFSETDPHHQEVSESPFRVKEETEQGRATFKQEFKESGPSPNADEVHTSEGSQRLGDPLADTRGTKPVLSHWEEASRDDPRPRPLQDQGTSARSDPSSAPQRDWLPGLDAGRSGEAGLELLAEGGGYPPSGGTTGGDGEANFYRPALGHEEEGEEEEEEEEEDDPALLFLDQNPDQDLAPEAGRDTRQDHNQRGASSSWRPRDRPRRANAARDPLRPHTPNALPNTHKHPHPLGHVGGGARPYTCPYCGKAFTYPSHQRRHLLRHTGVRLHPCSVCDKSFLTPSELTVHTRVHTGERPFGCSQCGKRFARSGNLRAHQRDVHMGKRPFGCDECGKRFAHRGNLRVHHHRVHQGAPYFLDPLQDGSPLPSNG
ncbi:zinc finger protein 324B-like isoform X2 [Osmerus eperlanus]|uniref:zinc finger protein 324B-like isoform X2 n=1 Tax=Osmerus eperlanus TaxID=29151 RepID=UPI002E159906